MKIYFASFLNDAHFIKKAIDYRPLKIDNSLLSFFIAGNSVYQIKNIRRNLWLFVTIVAVN